MLFVEGGYVMTKSIVITKEMIDVAAFELVRKEGVEALSARNIAKELNCSTQPIYNTYEGMDEIRRITVDRVIDFVMKRIVTYKKTGRPFLDSGLGYINFAKTERVLFREFQLNVSGANEKKNDLGDPQIRALMDGDEYVQEYNLTKSGKDNVFKKIMIFTYGVAVLSYLDRLYMSEEEVVTLLKDISEDYLKQEALGKKEEVME